MRYPVVLQHNQEDCGAACLATIAKYYGRTMTLNRLREMVGTGQLGTTLLGLRRGAEQLGFNAQAVQASDALLDHLDQAPLPLILHWQGIHWVVLYGQRRRKYVVADPAVGLRYLSRAELLEGWGDRVMLLLELDDARFNADEHDQIRGIGRFWQRLLPYRMILAEVLVLNLAVGVLTLAMPLLVQILTDDVLVRQDMQLLGAIALVVILINMFSSVMRFIQATLVTHFAERLELGIVLEFGRQILGLPLTYYESRRSGEIVSRLQDIQEINYFVTQAIISLPSQGFIAIVALILMAVYSVSLTLSALLVVMVMGFSTIIFLPSLKQKTTKLLVTEAENQGVLVETFKGAITLKTTHSADHFLDELQRRFGRLAKLGFQRMQIAILNDVFSRWVSSVGAIAILWIGGRLVVQETLSIGQLLAFTTLNQYVTFFVGTIVQLTDEFTRANVAAQRIGEVLDASPEETANDKPHANISGTSDIVCTHLNFCHAGRVHLLDDFSLTIPGGKVTALIGQSGCGKSTLVKLLASLYPLQSGNIRFGIYNQQDLSLNCLRQQVVLVPQEAHFWSRSILENFQSAHPHASFKQIVQACQIAHADEFINELPDQYQTVLGEFGANLSGGQRQRLALARSIVNDPPVLILDESTGALDPVLEAEVLDKLLFYRQGKTTIMISHRPRVIVRADWIAFLQKGQLIQVGSRQDLLEINGHHLAFLNP